MLLGIIIGTFIGAFLGVSVMCLLYLSKIHRRLSGRQRHVSALFKQGLTQTEKPARTSRLFTM